MRIMGVTARVELSHAAIALQSWFAAGVTKYRSLVLELMTNVCRMRAANPLQLGMIAAIWNVKLYGHTGYPVSGESGAGSGSTTKDERLLISV